MATVPGLTDGAITVVAMWFLALLLSESYVTKRREWPCARHRYDTIPAGMPP